MLQNDKIHLNIEKAERLLNFKSNFKESDFINFISLLANSLELRVFSRKLDSDYFYNVKNDDMFNNLIFLKNLLRKNIKKTNEGFIVYNWKNKYLIKNKDLEKILNEIKQLLNT